MKILRSIFALLIIVGVAALHTAPAQAESDIGIYLDSRRIEIDDSPLIVNGRVLLPMRALFEMFSLDVRWIASDRAVETGIADREIRLQIGSDRVLYRSLSHNDGDWYEAKTIDQPPVIINGRTYVPLRFMAEELNCVVHWDGDARTVSIRRPFVFDGGSWHMTDAMFWPQRDEGRYKPVDPDMDNVWAVGDLVFVSIWTGDDMTMGSTNLYVLDSGGSSRLIHLTRDIILSIKVDGDSCYILKSDWSWHATSSIVRIDLGDPFNQFRLGDASFSYGRYIEVDDHGDFFWLQNAGDDLDFEIRGDAIFTIGFDASLTPEGSIPGADRQEKLELLKRSYGYYLIPLDGGAHSFVENVLI